MQNESNGGISFAGRRVLSDGIYDTLLAMLMDNAIEPGSRITIDAIARELDVSPTPVREALARLESDGLVTKRPLHGYTAAPLLDQHGVDELFEMRLILEPEATRRAAINLNREQRATLDESVKEMRKIVASTHTSKNRFENYKAFASLDALFHEIIAEGSGNRMLTDAIVRLRAHRHNYRLHFDQGMTFETLAEHKIVLDALRKSDPESSERAMRSHILCSKERITSAIDRVC